MIIELTSVDEYMSFAEEIYGDENYRDPHLSSQEQIKESFDGFLTDESDKVLGVFENDVLTGLFAVMICPEDKYAEYLMGLSKSPEAYSELLAYLHENCTGFQVDFVFGPKNEMIIAELKKQAAVFYTEQQKMILKEYRKIQRKHTVTEYSERFREQYLAVHQDSDTYWTGEKVLDAPDLFRVILGIEDDKVVGYIDVTYCHEENEPNDVFVCEEYRNRGIAKEMLSLAIELNGDRKMELLVDVDNAAAIHLYENSGFVKTFGSNVTASIESMN